MFTQIAKSKESKSGSVANLVVQKKSNAKQGFRVVGNRHEIINRISTRNIINNSTRVMMGKLPDVSMVANIASAKHDGSRGVVDKGGVIQAYWAWQKGRLSEWGNIRYYEYEQYHVTWVRDDGLKTHIVYEHSDGHKSYYYPGTKTFSPGCRAGYEDDLRNAWNEFVEWGGYL